MNTLTLAALPVLAAAIISTQDPEPITPVIDELPTSPIEPAAPKQDPASAGIGLGPHRALQTGTLQMGTGLQSAARGLTPEREWRALFPVKPGTR